MIKLNEVQTMEMIFDLMSIHGLSFRNLANHFYDSRVLNQDSFLNTIELLKTDIKNKRVIDSKNLHDDLFKEIEK